jgi:hypothetical protein
LPRVLPLRSLSLGTGSPRAAAGPAPPRPRGLPPGGGAPAPPPRERERRAKGKEAGGPRAPGHGRLREPLPRPARLAAAPPGACAAPASPRRPRWPPRAPLAPPVPDPPLAPPVPDPPLALASASCSAPSRRAGRRRGGLPRRVGEGLGGEAAPRHTPSASSCTAAACVSSCRTFQARSTTMSPLLQAAIGRPTHDQGFRPAQHAPGRGTSSLILQCPVISVCFWSIGLTCD